MPHVVAIFGAKGGTGKTTLSFNLAAILARVGRRTVLLDLDPSGDAAAAAGVVAEGDLDITDSSRLRIQWTDGRLEVEQTTTPSSGTFATPSGGTRRPRLPGDPRPSPRVPDLEVVPMLGDADDETTAEHTYAITHRLRRDYELTIIDCPGRWGPCTRAAVRDADLVLIPLELPLDALSARAARRAARRIADLSSKPHPFGMADSIAVRNKDQQGPLVRGVGWSVSFQPPPGTKGRPASGAARRPGGAPLEEEPLPMLESIIPREATVAEAIASGRAVIDYEPGCRASRGFAEAAREVLGLLNSTIGRDATKYHSRRDVRGASGDPSPQDRGPRGAGKSPAVPSDDPPRSAETSGKPRVPEEA